MSSVTRFLRQIPTGLSTYSPTDVTSNLYVLIPGSGNYVGNYANAPAGVNPGYMVAIANVSGAAVFGNAPFVVRDMGKTTLALVSAAGNGTDLATSTPGYFRAVQVLSPTGVALPTSVTSFGVQGQVPGTFPAGNAGDMGYNTFYVPISVGGVVAASASGLVTPSVAAPVLAGQL
jgi:hypothetical protein